MILFTPSAEARAATVVGVVALIMLAPLNSALFTTFASWSRSALKSSFRAVRLAASRVVSEAARAFSFIWSRVSEMLSPAERATSTVEIERWRESLTAFSAPEFERWFWAMAQTAPLSLALATFRPVLIRF